MPFLLLTGNNLWLSLSTKTVVVTIRIGFLISWIAYSSPFEQIFPENVKSQRLALEITGLVTKTNGRVEADTGCHDDLALAYACAMYVRKYDPPLMVSSTQFMGMQSDLMDVVNFNQSETMEMSNAGIMKKVKDNLEDNQMGFIDIMSLYDSE